jgi:hypothetical protein
MEDFQNVARNEWEYHNEFAGSISQWKFITLKIQYTTLDYSQQLYNTRPNSTSPLTQLHSSLEKLSSLSHCRIHSNASV